MIKYNKCLTHLNLSGLGISKPMANLIIPAIRKTTTLTCLHLSGNPCMQRLNIKEVQEAVRAKDHPDSRFVQPSRLLKASGQEEMAVLNRLAKMKRFRNQDIDIGDPLMNSVLLLQRKLGHSVDMPGAA